ncbi:MAG: hypothetical protein H7329_02510 [Opitutaceae bacterium]|nr:hypothetical protein [Cytophagales bacterium]
MRQLALNKLDWRRGDRGFVFSQANAIFLVFLLLISIICSANPGSDTLFVNHHLHTVPRHKAQLFILKQDLKKSKEGLRWTQNTYFLNGQLQSTCPVVALKDDPKHPRKDGVCKEYTSTGSLRKITTYAMGRKSGSYVDYYSNGHPRMIGRIGEDQKIYVHNIMDSTGKDQLINGNGLVCAYDTVFNYLTYFHVIESLKQHSFYIDSLTNDTVYTSMDTKPRTKSTNMDFDQTVIVTDLPYEKVKKFMGKNFMLFVW